MKLSRFCNIQNSKINKRLQWSENQVNQLIELLKFFSDFITAKPTKRAVRDPDDSFLLDALITSEADHLITGNKDLLVLRSHYPIISLAEFFELLF